MRIAALYGVFFVSGFCGLIYESIWSHYLKLLLGHAAYAQVVVLVVFVGGLALGAWLTGRWSERIRHPILVYALVEACVAAFSFGFHGLFTTVSDWALEVYMPAFCSADGACPAVWLLAAALILPPSILLGTTFPLMSAGVLRLGAGVGRGLSLLYFLNSAGAALGVLCSGFVLIPLLGLPGAMLVAGSLNAIVALAAYLAVQLRAPTQAPAPIQAGNGTLQPVPPGGASLLLWVAALTGLSSFVYEVVWIRQLTLVLGAATHSFELMLAPFILGLALGAWWIRHRADSTARPELLLAKIQIAMGLLAMATLPLYAWCFEAMALMLRALSRTDAAYALFNVASALLAAAVMLPATFCAGMTLPLITALLIRRGAGERQIGRVYGVNTVGAIAGVVLAVHLLIPALGLKWSLAVAALVDVALGAVLWWVVVRHERPMARSLQNHGPAFAAMTAVAAIMALASLVPLSPQQMASGVFRSGASRIASDHRVVFHRDGKTATVTVVQTSSGERSLLTNGKSDGSLHPDNLIVSADDHTVVLLGALGPIHHPNAKRAAVIGLGTGVTTSVLLKSPALESVETIEIEPLMLQAAEHFRPRSAPVFDDPRSRIVIDDARAHFAKTQSRYDIIVSEPSNPWVSGVAGLFTIEFYERVWQQLSDEGHFVQWLQLYEASPEMVSSILNAFSMVFPEFVAYNTNAADIVLVARKDGRLPRLDRAALDGMAGMRSQLIDIRITSAAMLAAHNAGRSGAIRLLAGSYGVLPNSDYYPYVDGRATKDRFQSQSAAALFGLSMSPVPLLEFGNESPDYLGHVQTATRQMPGRVLNMASAWHGHRYLRGETITTAERGYMGSLVRDYALLRSWIGNCRFPTDDDAAWDAVLRVASELNPGLPASLSRKFWQDLLSGPCAAVLSARQTALLQVFAAVGGRDAPATDRWATRALEDKGLSSEAREYLVLAGVSARLSQGRPEEAAKLFAEYGKSIPAARANLPWFRYIGLLAGLKRTERTPEPARPR